MKIFNIYPVKNQTAYAKEDYAMILAHLLKKGLYDYKLLNSNRYIIMDNGAYEDSKVSNSVFDLVSLVNRSNIVVDEIVIPDVIGDYEKTLQLYKDNYTGMYANRDDYNFMYVAHSRDYNDLKDAIEMVNNERYLHLTLGIPKHSKINRTSDEAIALYKTCKVPIHFLGINDSFAELNKVKNIIRSCDSVQLVYLARDHSVQDKDLIKQKRQDPVINLETDSVNENKLSMMKITVDKELKLNGILR